MHQDGNIYSVGGFFFPYNVSAATAQQSHDQLANPILVPLLKVPYFLPCW